MEATWNTDHNWAVCISQILVYQRDLSLWFWTPPAAAWFNNLHSLWSLSEPSGLRMRTSSAVHNLMTNMSHQQQVTQKNKGKHSGDYWLFHAAPAPKETRCLHSSSVLLMTCVYLSWEILVVFILSCSLKTVETWHWGHFLCWHYSTVHVHLYPHTDPRLAEPRLCQTQEWSAVKNVVRRMFMRHYPSVDNSSRSQTTFRRFHSSFTWNVINSCVDNKKEIRPNLLSALLSGPAVVGIQQDCWIICFREMHVVSCCTCYVSHRTSLNEQVHDSCSASVYPAAGRKETAELLWPVYEANFTCGLKNSFYERKLLTLSFIHFWGLFHLHWERSSSLRASRKDPFTTGSCVFNSQM